MLTSWISYGSRVLVAELIVQHTLIALEGVTRTAPGRELLRKLNAIEVVVKAASLAVSPQSKDAVSKLLALLPLQQDVQKSIEKLGEVGWACWLSEAFCLCSGEMVRRTHLS